MSFEDCFKRRPGFAPRRRDADRVSVVPFQSVVRNISGSWSGDQRVAGPILVVPYSERVEIRDEFITPEGEKRFSQRWETCQRRAIVLPDRLKYEGSLVPEMRHRGIYQVQVYTADLVVSGIFVDLEATIASLVPDDRLEDIDWEKAVVGFGVSDPRGLVQVDGFEFNGRNVQPKPGTTLDELLPSGFHMAVGDTISDDLEFNLNRYQLF